MAGRTSSLEQQLQVIIIIIIIINNSNNNNNNVMDYRIPIYVLVYCIVGPSIPGPLLEEHDGRVQQPI